MSFMDRIKKHTHPGKLELKASIDLLIRECTRFRNEVIGPGPWDGEPDYQQFESHGLHCIIARNPMMFNWCGYVAIPPGHPAYGKSWNELREIDIHGGLTYATECGNHICHLPKDGEPDQFWWLGFDCAHAGDLIPGVEVAKKYLNSSFSGKTSKLNNQTYKTYDYVRKETEYLAKQLSEMWGKDGSGGFYLN